MPRTPRQQCSGRAWQAATRPHLKAWAAANLPCALCHQPINYALRWPHRWCPTVDHRTPLWAGGHPWDPANWQPAHRTCNSSRGATEGNQQRKTPTHTTAHW
jgi:5-methylcytosine-specific restriction endonuclease McrA